MISFLTRKINIQKLTASGFYSKNHQDKDSEPKGPNVKTEIPGPNSKKILEKLNIRPSIGTAELFGNYEKSAGNYLVDVDGNIFLDLNMQDSKIPLGYNFKELSRLFSDPKSLHGVSDVITLSMFPGPTCPNKMEYIIDKVSPNMSNLCLCPCETSAIQEALKSLILAYQKQRQQQKNLNFLESRNALLNRTEDLQKLSILSFKNSQHGYSPEYSNLCNTEVWKKLHITKFDWPMAYYPEYKYPLEDNYYYNDSQDRKSIAMIEDFIEKFENKDLPIAGIVIEPIQNSTNHAASENFLKKLEELTFKYGIYLMFDEIKTCCGTTGKFWAHEHSCLNCPPDILVFGGNTQISGFFHREDLCPIENVRFFATGSISLAKILIFETIIDLMEQENLLKNVRKTGELLKNGLLELEKKYDLIHSTRGMGTLLAFDARCSSLRDNLIMKLRKKGIICGKSRNQSIKLRPSLTFNEKHAATFLEKLENVLNETKPSTPTVPKSKLLFLSDQTQLQPNYTTTNEILILKSKSSDPKCLQKDDSICNIKPKHGDSNSSFNGKSSNHVHCLNPRKNKAIGYWARLKQLLKEKILRYPTCNKQDIIYTKVRVPIYRRRNCRIHKCEITKPIRGIYKESKPIASLNTTKPSTYPFKDREKRPCLRPTDCPKHKNTQNTNECNQDSRDHTKPLSKDKIQPDFRKPLKWSTKCRDKPPCWNPKNCKNPKHQRGNKIKKEESKTCCRRPCPKCALKFCPKCGQSKKPKPERCPTTCPEQSNVKRCARCLKPISQCKKPKIKRHKIRKLLNEKGICAQRYIKKPKQKIIESKKREQIKITPCTDMKNLEETNVVPKLKITFILNPAKMFEDSNNQECKHQKRKSECQGPAQKKHVTDSKSKCSGVIPWTKEPKCKLNETQFKPWPLPKQSTGSEPQKPNKPPKTCSSTFWPEEPVYKLSETEIKSWPLPEKRIYPQPCSKSENLSCSVVTTSNKSIHAEIPPFLQSSQSYQHETNLESKLSNEPKRKITLKIKRHGSPDSKMCRHLCKPVAKKSVKYTKELTNKEIEELKSNLITIMSTLEETDIHTHKKPPISEILSKSNKKQSDSNCSDTKTGKLKKKKMNLKSKLSKLVQELKNKKVQIKKITSKRQSILKQQLEELRNQLRKFKNSDNNKTKDDSKTSDEPKTDKDK